LSSSNDALSFEPRQDIIDRNKVKLLPMSPLAASATVVNLLLATGPFSYPYGYVSLGPAISAPLLFIVAILAYITATYLVEAISIAAASSEGKV